MSKRLTTVPLPPPLRIITLAEVLAMMKLSSYTVGKNGDVTLSHTDFNNIIHFLADAFTDIKAINDKVEYVSELLQLKKCWDEDGIVYGASVRVVLKLTDKKLLDTLKKQVDISEMATKYKDLFNHIKAI